MTFDLGGQAISTDLGPDVVLLVVAVAVLYETLIRRFGIVLHPRAEDPAVLPRQRVAFHGALVVFWIASGSPLHVLSEDYLFSAHMIQHLLQAFVVPPLLLLGIPTWMGELLLRNQTFRSGVTWLCRPVIAGVLFNLWLLLTHWPPVIDAMLTNDAIHAVDHFFLVGASLAMWMVVLSPVPRLVPRLHPLGQMFYLFLMTLVPTIPASFLTFGETVLYPRYATFPRLWGLSALGDMQIAGLIMKIGGGFFLWGVIAVLYFRWAVSEERRDARPSTRAASGVARSR